MILTLVVLFIVLWYIFFGRHWMNTWGATAAETRATFAGDDLIVKPQSQSTRAITIHAPAAIVWQWLVQIGQGRGGFYSYDGLENIFGLDIHTVDTIKPALQTLALDDSVKLAKEGFSLRVARLEHECHLTLCSVDPKTQTYPQPDDPNYYSYTWSFILKSVDDQTTRLISRTRGVSTPWWGKIMNEAIGPISFIMEHKMLRGIKSRAERLAHQTKATA